MGFVDYATGAVVSSMSFLKQPVPDSSAQELVPRDLAYGRLGILSTLPLVVLRYHLQTIRQNNNRRVVSSASGYPVDLVIRCALQWQCTSWTIVSLSMYFGSLVVNNSALSRCSSRRLYVAD